jgi:peptidoglycan-associated lipoprotein
MKRTGLFLSCLAVLIVVVVAGCCSKKVPPQPPIPPPPETTMVNPPEPPTPVPPTPTPLPVPKVIGELKIVHFDFDQAAIRPGDAKILDDDAKYLRDNPGVKITLEGYCDPIGTDEYNRGLGLRRANAVKAYLAKLGIADDRLSVTSYGKEKLVTTDPKQFELNRRVEFVAK